MERRRRDEIVNRKEQLEITVATNKVKIRAESALGDFFRFTLRLSLWRALMSADPSSDDGREPE